MKKDYTLAELLTFFSADFLDHIYLHNVIPPESPCATISVSVPTLNLLIFVIPTPNNYKIYYCNNCPMLSPILPSQLRPLVNNQTLTQVLSLSQNRLVAHTPKQINSPNQKQSSFKFFNKKPQTKETKEHPYSVITTAKFADRPPPTGHSPHLPPQSVIPYPPIKTKRNYTKRKYTKRKHNNNNNNQ